MNCYICDTIASFICNICNSNVCENHSLFHGNNCIIGNTEKISRLWLYRYIETKLRNTYVLYVHLPYYLIRPEINDDLVNEVKILSGNATGSFEDSLLILVAKYKKLAKGVIKKNE